MRLAITVNNLAIEYAAYTTTRIALAATRMGHEVWYIDIADFVYDPDENIHAHAHMAPPERKYHSPEDYLTALRSEQAVSRYINLSHVDALLLRNNPADDSLTRPWARSAGIDFGRFAAKCGVLVLNDPEGLSNANDKLYLQQFPQSVRPKCLITRDRKQIEEFARQEGGRAVIKPLSGSGGRNVFLIHPEDAANLHQMIETVARDDYIVVQEYLPQAVKGDTRLFLLNGRPLEYEGKIAALRRVREAEDGDMRSNMTAGAHSAPAEVNEEMLELVQAVTPRLKHDGMFFAGLDIVGNKIMEINVFSPGGLDSAEHFEKVNFSEAIIKDIERKVHMKQHSKFVMRNREWAVL